MSPFSSTFYRGLVKCGSCISFQRNSKNLKLSQLSTEFPESVPKVWVQARSLGDPAEVLLFDKVQAQDVQQGRLGDCWSSQLCLGRFGTVVDSCWYFWCLFLVVTWWLTFDMWRDSSLCSRQHSDSSVILIVFCDRAQLACFYVQTGVFLLFFLKSVCLADKLRTQGLCLFPALLRGWLMLSIYSAGIQEAGNYMLSRGYWAPCRVWRSIPSTSRNSLRRRKSQMMDVMRRVLWDIFGTADWFCGRGSTAGATMAVRGLALWHWSNGVETRGRWWAPWLQGTNARTDGWTGRLETQQAEGPQETDPQWSSCTECSLSFLVMYELWRAFSPVSGLFPARLIVAAQCLVLWTQFWTCCWVPEAGCLHSHILLSSSNRIFMRGALIGNLEWEDQTRVTGWLVSHVPILEIFGDYTLWKKSRTPIHKGSFNGWFPTSTIGANLHPTTGRRDLGPALGEGGGQVLRASQLISLEWVTVPPSSWA